MAVSTEAFLALGVECSNCGADADFDVEVMDVNTGTVVRDVFACEACAESIDVGEDYYVGMDAV